MKALELAASLKAAWINGHLSYSIACGAGRELRRLAAVEAELERIKALEPTHWQVTQGTRSFVMTAAEFNMSTFDYGSFVALYTLGSKT